MQDQKMDLKKEVSVTAVATLYSKPHCVQCSATERKFKKSNIDYQYIDVTTEPTALEKLKELGYLQAPVVYVNEDVHWSGHRPDLIEKHLG